MGSSEAEKQSFEKWGFPTDDETRQGVKMSKGFWLCEHETTQGEWSAVMGKTVKDQAKRMLEDDTKYATLGNKMQRELFRKQRTDDPGSVVVGEGGSVPIYFVSWSEAAQYCERLTEREHRAGSLPAEWKYALPTEAQWEYACRAGTGTPIYSGNLRILGENNAPALDEIAWYGGNSSEGYRGLEVDLPGWPRVPSVALKSWFRHRGLGVFTTNWPEKQYPGGVAGARTVGQKKPNAWGLHDMLGNVSEWCSDWYKADYTNDRADPKGAASGVFRVARGGSWHPPSAFCRAAFRTWNVPEIRSFAMGFRPALVSSR